MIVWLPFCCKCGYTNFKKKYVPTNDSTEEHLENLCECGYTWDTPCNDVKERNK